MTEQEEFEFRQRLEREQEQAASGVGSSAEIDQVNPLYGVAGGAFAGQILGPAINKGVEAVRSGAPGAASAPGAPGGASPGQKFAAKTGYGSGTGFTVEEVVEHKKAQEKPIGKGKISSKIAGNSPMNVDRMLQLEAAKKAEDARRAAALAQGASSLPGPVQAAGRFIGGAAQSGVTPYVGRGVAGAGAGFQGVDAYNRFQQGDYPGAAISGLGALGSAASFIPTPVTRIGGPAIGVGAELLNQYLDSLKKKVEGMDQPVAAPAPAPAAPGAAPGMAKGGKVGALESIAKKLFDPRFDKRVREIPKLQSQVRHVEPTQNFEAPKIYLPDYEGRPFVTSMSDRTDASGKLLGLNNQMFQNPIDLTGGQGYMFDPRNPGKVWESGKGPSSAIAKTAAAAKDFTGMDPIYLPWRMAPTGSDFSPMTGETMLAHAQSVMGKKEKAAVDNLLKNYIPNWKGLDNPESFEQFGSASTKARKAAQNAMDKHFRNEGGLGIGEARLAISDPTQINAPEGGLQNVGRIFSGQPIIRSGEGSRYPYGVPGEGLGVIDRDINIAQLLPKWAKERGIEDVTRPGATDMRSLQMKPYSGILTDKLLMSVGYKKGGAV